MKKVVQILAGIVLCLGFAGGVASASELAGNCEISGTGPDSINKCTIDEDNSVTVNCNNDVVVTNNNGQISTSGNANGSGNTSSGLVLSGDASNINEVVNELAANCESKQAPAPAPSKSKPVAVAQAEEQKPAAPQAQAPKGAVEAGAGGASKADNTVAALGLAASIGVVVGGSALVRKFAE